MSRGRKRNNRKARSSRPLRDTDGESSTSKRYTKGKTYGYKYRIRGPAPSPVKVYKQDE